MKKVVIDRKTWNSGKRLGMSPSLLSSATGSRCCLGFLCGAYGVDAERMRDACYPSSIRVRETGLVPAALFEGSSWHNKDDERIEWQSCFATLNDFKDIDDATREAWIAEGFRTVLGCEVEFVGEYP